MMSTPRAGTLTLLSSSFETLLTLEHQIAPASLHAIAFLANAGIENLHPAFFIACGVGIEVDYLAIVEADSETFFDEHVAFFLFCEARLAALAMFTNSLLLSECTSVVDELGCVGEVDCGSRLAG